MVDFFNNNNNKKNEREQGREIFVLMGKHHFKGFENDLLIFISYLCLIIKGIYIHELKS